MLCCAQVPKERLLALALGRGPTGAALDLRHARRSQAALLDEMGRLLLNVCLAVPQVCRRFTWSQWCSYQAPLNRNFLSEVWLAQRQRCCSCVLCERCLTNRCCLCCQWVQGRVTVLQGVVVFFPSFAYADQVHGHWQATGALERLGHRKHVFREPRSAVEVEAVLR